MRWAGHVARFGEERRVYRFIVEYRRERDHWGDLVVDGWITLGHLQEVGCRYMDWIGLTQDRDGCGRRVSAVMNVRVP